MTKKRRHPKVNSRSYSSTRKTITINSAQSGPSISSGTDSGSIKWVNDRADGSSNPMWKSQIRAHQSATTPLNGTIRNFEYGDGYAWATSISKNPSGYPIQRAELTGPTWITGTSNTLPGTPGPIPSAVDLAARIDFLKSVRSTYRQFQGGIFLGELRETIHMIRRPAEGIRRGLDLYHRTVKNRLRKARLEAGLLSGRIRPRDYTDEHQRRDIKRAMRMVQDTWLESVFGWRPLISDVMDGMKALGSRDFQEFVPVRGKGKSSVSSDSVSSTGLGLIWLRCNTRDTTNYSVRYKGEVGSSAASVNVANFDRWGFGSWKEALPTIWELIPYSFLVDYFTNIGDIVDGFATQTARVRWCLRSELATFRREKSVSFDQTASQAAVQAIAIISGGSCSYGGYVNEVKTFARSSPSVVSVGVSDLSFRLPGVGSTRWLNIAALARLRS